MLYPTELRADMKKAHTVSFFEFFGRSTRIRTLDPLVPNQVRYQAAPHSANGMIIVRKIQATEGKSNFLRTSCSQGFTIRALSAPASSCANGPFVSCSRKRATRVPKERRMRQPLKPTKLPLPLNH